MVAGHRPPSQDADQVVAPRSEEKTANLITPVGKLQQLVTREGADLLHYFQWVLDRTVELRNAPCSKFELRAEFFYWHHRRKFLDC